MVYEGSAGLVCCCMSLIILMGRDWTLFPHLLILGERRPLRRRGRLSGPKSLGYIDNAKSIASGIPGWHATWSFLSGTRASWKRGTHLDMANHLESARDRLPLVALVALHPSTRTCLRLPQRPNGRLLFLRLLQSLASPLPLHPVCTMSAPCYAPRPPLFCAFSRCAVGEVWAETPSPSTHGTAVEMF